MITTKSYRIFSALVCLIPTLTLVLTIGMIFFTGLAWVRRSWSFSGRIFYTMVSLAAVGFLGWLNYFNLF
jgi:hypothetical protein